MSAELGARQAPWSAWLAGAMLWLAVVGLGSAARAAERDLGPFGPTCAAQMRLPEGVPTTGPAWPASVGARLSLVVDLGCPGTLAVAQGLAQFRHLHRMVEVEVLMLNPGVLRTLGPERGTALFRALDGVPLSWDPLRLAALRPRRVPLVRLDDGQGHVVLAEGQPDLEALWGALGR